MSEPAYVLNFSELSLTDVAEAGGKGASLGELYRELSTEGVRVPNGFVITATAYRTLLAHNELESRVNAELESLDPRDVNSLRRAGKRLRAWLLSATLPPELITAITTAYARLGDAEETHPNVAVRSSATAEDLPDASFAGQQDSYLNVHGEDMLLARCKAVFASLYTDRAIAYRAERGYSQTKVALAIVVQKMVRADLAASGVVFTLDTESGFRDLVLITAAYGLGENVVQGAVSPDEFQVFKPTLRQGFNPLIKRKLGGKAIQCVYTADGQATQNLPTPELNRRRYCLTDAEVLRLARIACTIERHYSNRAGKPQPMDIEWAKDGRDGQIYIVQARPETVHARHATDTTQLRYILEQQGEILVSGTRVGERIASGNARILTSPDEMSRFQPGEVLVADMTDPDWEPIMQRAAGIVTQRGGRTCHAAIIARELGIPAIVGAADAMTKISDGALVTLNCTEGDTGEVYAGRLPFRIEVVPSTPMARPRTQIMLNIGNPDQAFKLASLPVDGVGLARLEFIVNSYLRVHPRAILNYDSLPADTQRQIDTLAQGYPSPGEFYVQRLAEGVSQIAAAFYPKPVIVRLGDFKSNEYAQLLGGRQYEPVEENPMLGLRGAARYYAPGFDAAFALECQALKRVREEFGLLNVALMIPFVRTVSDLRAVLARMAQEGLVRGAHDLKIYVMCEIPANALLADDFLGYCDGFSIGSNDLTQLTLGVDRDSGLLSGYDERNPAVLSLMALAIAACRRAGKYIGICGQAPSDFPEITRWLVEREIHSISLNPDSVLAMLPIILAAE